MEDMEDYKDNIHIKCEPLSYDLDGVNSAAGEAYVTPTLACEKFIKTEVEENEEEEKIDIKFESLDYEPRRPIIENASENVKQQFECHICSRKSKNKYTLKSHILYIHEREKAPRYACELCPYEAVRKQELNKHRYIHEKIVTLECTICQKSFKRKLHLDAHYVSIHRDQRDSFKHLLTNKVNQCSKCSFATINKSSFKYHVLTHEKDRDKFNFECYTCGYKCVQKANLIKHLQIHADQLPYACSECDKRFKQKQQLDGHIVSRHKENEELINTVTSKIHQCLRCSYKTVKSSDFKRHKKYCNNK